LSKQPIPETCPASGTRSGQLPGFLFGLAPDGVFRASAIALGAVGSYPAFSPLPPTGAGGGLSFCGTFRRKILTFLPRVSLACRQGLRGIAPCGVRTFLPRLTPEAILRPSKIANILSRRRSKSKLWFEAVALRVPFRKRLACFTQYATRNTNHPMRLPS
jgi:hypothetical protein